MILFRRRGSGGKRGAGAMSREPGKKSSRLQSKIDEARSCH
jgi:hypothetical protein